MYRYYTDTLCNTQPLNRINYLPVNNRNSLCSQGYKMKQNLNIATSLVTLLLFFVSSSIIAQSKSENKKLRLFIIGNSFSQNASAYLPAIAKESNMLLKIGRAELGGCSLERHWKNVELSEANPQNPEGMPYNGKSLRMLLSEDVWDVITLQQFSFLSVDVNTYQPYALNLYNYIKSILPKAKIVFHQTWAYRWDAKGFGRIEGFSSPGSDKEMWKKSRAAYHTIAKELNIGIIPVGDAFIKVASKRENSYKKDVAFDFEKPVYPSLPNQKNSLHEGFHWDKERKFSLDANHASEAGKYLGALIWFACLFNSSAQEVQFIPSKVSGEHAADLKKVADKVVKRKNIIKYK